jgi:pimeloyl-ACP methyl ester carboxylesterase
MSLSLRAARRFSVLGLCIVFAAPAIDELSARRRHAIEAMQQVMGSLPKTVPASLDVLVSEETVLAGIVRRKITFASGDGDRVPAYLFLPDGRKGRAPAVLCLHQTTDLGMAEPAGLGGKPNLRYALELAQKGFVTLAPDYPGFGEYRIDVYAMGYASATMKGIRNHMRAVDLLVSLPEVNPLRIGVIGHSLGGHNALFLAAFDPRVSAVVSSCGFTSFRKYYGGDLTGWSHKGYMPRIATVYGKSPERMPFDFPDVLAAIAPRPVFINAPLRDANFDSSGVDDCVLAVKGLYGERLIVVHPACEHDFPPEIRAQAYAFLERSLGGVPAAR